MCREIMCFFNHYAAHLNQLCGQNVDNLVRNLVAQIFITKRLQWDTENFEIYVVIFP